MNFMVFLYYKHPKSPKIYVLFSVFNFGGIFAKITEDGQLGAYPSSSILLFLSSNFHLFCRSIPHRLPHNIIIIHWPAKSIRRRGRGILLSLAHQNEFAQFSSPTSLGNQKANLKGIGGKLGG